MTVIYIFMSLMLLITKYCCSVHVFFLHLAFLWWEEVIQDSAGVNVCDKNCISDEKRRNWMI